MTKLCQEEGCGRPHLAQGRCSLHYQRARDAGLGRVLIPDRKCEQPGCNNKHAAKGLCRAHYLRLYKHGRLEKVLMRGEPLLNRIMAKVEKQPDGCWLVKGHTAANGYGSISRRGTMARAHRALYELRKGPVPEGMELDHLCRTRACVNPDHLEIVTHQENCRRGSAGRNWLSLERDKRTGRFLSSDTPSP